MSAVRESICSSTDTERSLNENLIHVFALVKELQRRLAGGDIVVEATDLDHKLAKSSDFVEIVDEMAVSRNHGTVRDTEYSWNRIPYEVQIMGGVLLHYKYATEMATGEGKTLVAVMPALLNALSGKGVHVMTVNDYLSLRDFEITRPIYSFFGLTVAVLRTFLVAASVNKMHTMPMLYLDRIKNSFLTICLITLRKLLMNVGKIEASIMQY